MSSDISIIDDSIKVDFIDESLEMLGDIHDQFARLESEPGNVDALNIIYRTMCSINGNCAYFGLMKIKKLAHELESLMYEVRLGIISVSSDLKDVILSSCDYLVKMFVRIKDKSNDLENDTEFDEMLQRVTMFSDKDKSDVDVIWNDLKQTVTELESIPALGDSVDLLVRKISSLISKTDELKSHKTKMI